MTRRLFVSIDLPQGICDGIAAVQEPFHDLSGVRLTEPDQSHVTMKFLGDVADRRIERVTSLLVDAVEDAAVAPFEATVEGIGVFPSFEYISVIWLGLRQGASPMTELHRAMEARFVEAGFEPEEHDFTPHVTIARMDHAASKDRVQELVSDRDPRVGSFEVRDLRLKESTLTDDGPVYETLEAVQL